jgi:hypothetical protein
MARPPRATKKVSEPGTLWYVPKVGTSRYVQKPSTLLDVQNIGTGSVASPGSFTGSGI